MHGIHMLCGGADREPIRPESRRYIEMPDCVSPFRFIRWMILYFLEIYYLFKLLYHVLLYV